MIAYQTWLIGYCPRVNYFLGEVPNPWWNPWSMIDVCFFFVDLHQHGSYSSRVVLVVFLFITLFSMFHDGDQWCFMVTDLGISFRSVWWYTSQFAMNRWWLNHQIWLCSGIIWTDVFFCSGNIPNGGILCSTFLLICFHAMIMLSFATLIQNN